MNTFLVDATAITLDLNWFKRTYSKAKLETREFKWGYSPTHGHYIGYKLTLALDSRSLQPVCFLLHPGTVCLNELLLGLVISLGFDKKIDLQRLS